MKNKVIVFFGLGGAGQRHLRILNKFKKKFALKFYAVRKINKIETINKNFTSSKTKLIYKYKNLVYLKEKQAYFSKGFAIIANPTSHHYKTAIKCAKANMNIFVEKPFFCSFKNLNQILNIVKKKKLTFLVGYQKRFSEIIKVSLKLIKKFDKKKIKEVKVEVNSFLPHWHKYEDFKSMYASRKSLGGGSLLTESHELDIILMFFGIPDKIYCKKYYNIKFIDVESNHDIVFSYGNFAVVFKINMFNKKIKKIINIVYDKNIYKIDLVKNKIYINDKVVYFNKNKTFLNKDFEEQMKFFLSKKININKSLLQIRANLLALLACIKSDKSNKEIFINKKTLSFKN